MGESAQNKNSKQQKPTGPERRQARAQKALQEKKKFRRNTTIIAVVFVVLLAVSVLINSNFLKKDVPAVKIGKWNFSATDVNFYYYSEYYNLSSQYGDYLSYFLDTNKPLDQQQYSDTQTWADYLQETALNKMQEICILNDTAKKAGYKLSDDAKKSIADVIESYKSSYKQQDFASVTALLEAKYGKGTTESSLKKNLELQYLAYYYAKDYSDALKFTDDELSAYYAKNKDTKDVFTYREYKVSGAADETNGIDSTKAMANAKAIAEKIAAAKTEAEYNSLVYANAPEAEKATYENGAGTIKKYQSSSSFTAGTSEWLLDSSRAKGNTTVIESSDGYTVLYFIERNNNSYNVKNVRHILFKVEDKTNADQYAEALKKAQAVYDQWKSGSATEDSFAELAKTNSADSNASEGGFYAVNKGQMVAEFEDWCFAANRKVGDSGIVKTDYGYHIMYYAGEGEPYWKSLATSGLKDETYAKMISDQKGSYAINKTFAIKFTK